MLEDAEDNVFVRVFSIAFVLYSKSDLSLFNCVDFLNLALEVDCDGSLAQLLLAEVFEEALLCTAVEFFEPRGILCSEP